MTKKITQAIVLATIILLSLATPAFADELGGRDKEIKLKLVLKKYNSPFQGLEKVLIDTAEQYNLDWTVLAAISGTESSFAKRMPYQCINPFGWGIYGDNKLCFDSLELAIKGVGEGLGTKYNTSSLEAIARTYNPSYTAKWLSSTRFFINRIKNQVIPVSELPIEF